MISLEQAFKRVAVLGAAGKMGSGISLLLLQEMARLEAESSGMVGNGDHILYLIDPNEDGIVGLQKYLRDQIQKYAEKNINLVRSYYANSEKLISNEQIIEAFIQGAISITRLETHTENCKRCHLIFEAVIEDVEIKSKILKSINNKEAYYFSNTSSIPIRILNEKADLNHRIIGCHFYNPPAIQKLVEIIAEDNGDPVLTALTLEISKRLGKTVIESKDVAGFIGNGHFIREVVYACEKSQQLAELPITDAIRMINQVTQEFLIRPMGIFQLMDYVGLEVVQHICGIMREYLDDKSLMCILVDELIAAGILGGQFPDGKQKNGFFKYENGKIAGIYSTDKKDYILLPSLDATGHLPKGFHTWKQLVNDPEKDKKLEVYFQNLFSMTTIGASLAQAFLLKSYEIARKLVSDGVAKDMKDVDIVLMEGFFHLYGPGSDLIKSREGIL